MKNTKVWTLNDNIWSIATNPLLHTSLQVLQEFLPISTNETSSFHFHTHTCVQWSRTPGCSPSLRKPRRRRISPICLHAASVETSCLAKQTFEAELVYLAGWDMAQMKDTKITLCKTQSQQVLWTHPPPPVAIYTDFIITAFMFFWAYSVLCSCFADRQ